MKKKKYLFCTKVWYYLTELPLVVLLVISIYYNPMTKTTFKLIPLIIALCLGIIFIFIFFFRLIVVSHEQIRYRGWFSSRDKAVINKDKTLIITMLKGANIKIELFGNDGEPSLYESMKDEPPIDIYLFRGRAIGGARTVRSILSYFEIPSEDITELLSLDSFAAEYELTSLSSEKKEDVREIRIRMKETI